MPRRILGGTLAALVLALLPSTAVADTVDPAPVRAFTAHQGWGVAVSPATGLIYAPDDSGTVHVYAPAASGAAPTEAFSFPEPPTKCLYVNPVFERPWSPVFDASGHNLAINCTGFVGLYFVDANGVATYRGGISGFTGLTSSVFDSSGRLVVADRFANTLSIWDITALPATPFPISVSGLDEPLGLAISGDTLYIANSGSANNVLEVAYPGGNPVRSITMGSGMSTLDSVQVDSAGHVYVSSFDGGLAVYAPDASGAATPLKRVTGPTSGLTGGLTSMVIDAKRNIYVSQLNTPGKYSTFAPLFPLPTPPAATVAPGAVTKLAVAGKKTDKKRTVTWTAGPAGSSPITSYDVVVTKGKKKLVSKTVTGTKLVLKRKKLKSGKLTVTVTARTAVGAGPPTSTTFKVKVPKKPPVR